MAMSKRRKKQLGKEKSTESNDNTNKRGKIYGEKKKKAKGRRFK